MNQQEPLKVIRSKVILDIPGLQKYNPKLHQDYTSISYVLPPKCNQCNQCDKCSKNKIIAFLRINAMDSDIDRLEKYCIEQYNNSNDDKPNIILDTGVFKPIFKDDYSKYCCEIIDIDKQQLNEDMKKVKQTAIEQDKKDINDLKRKQKQLHKELNDKIDNNEDLETYVEKTVVIKNLKDYIKQLRQETDKYLTKLSDYEEVVHNLNKKYPNYKIDGPKLLAETKNKLGLKNTDNEINK